jgi:hypothetical protein
MPKCPGQDKLFWTADDVYEVDCPACGEAVEFFKTDPARRCPGCGYTSPNPHLDAGCAQWCPHAELCAGIKLVTEAEADQGRAGTVRLVDRLLVAVRDQLGRDKARTVRVLEALQQAQKLLVGKDANPRVVLGAVVLHDVPPEAARGILAEAEVDEETIAQVLSILQGEGAATAEGALVAKAWQQLEQPEPVAVGSEG